MTDTEEAKVIREGDAEMETLNAIHTATLLMFRINNIDSGFALNIALAVAVTLVRELERAGHQRQAILGKVTKFFNENLTQQDADEARAKGAMQ